VRTISIDLLHTLFLGPILAWCKLMMWKMLLDCAWYSGPAAVTQEEKIILNLAMMLEELHEWYRTCGIVCSQIGDITAKMIGTAQKRTLKLKAMESFGFLQYLLFASDKHRLCLGADVGRYIECGRVLVRVVEIYKSSPAAMSVSSRQELIDLWNRHVILAKDLGICLPKTHLMFHLHDRIENQGNPWLYQCFLDESLNKDLKKVLRLCHQSNFEVAAMVKLRGHLRQRGIL